MGVLGSVAGAIAFAVAGIVAVIVGSFMIRGNMHMWDKRSKNRDDRTEN